MLLIRVRIEFVHCIYMHTHTHTHLFYYLYLIYNTESHVSDRKVHVPHSASEQVVIDADSHINTQPGSKAKGNISLYIIQYCISWTPIKVI